MATKSTQICIIIDYIWLKHNSILKTKYLSMNAIKIAKRRYIFHDKQLNGKVRKLELFDNEIFDAY